MKKRSLSLLLMWVLLTVSLAGMPFVSADVGPKPVTRITIRGLTNSFDFDLLVPLGAGDHGMPLLDLEDEDNFRFYYQDAYPITALNGYLDSDGYASYTLYFGDIPHHISEIEAENPGERVFQIGYFSPPTRFKIALFTEEGALVVSPVIETTMFQSEVIYDLTAEAAYVESQGAAEWPDVVPISAGTAWEEIPTRNIVGDFFLRLGLTLVLEMTTLVIFGYRRKGSFLLVLLVNVITQSLLLGALMAEYHFWGGTLGALILLILAELPVFVVEIVLYVWKLKEKTRVVALLYALAANLVSFFLSLGSVFLLQ